MVSSRATRKRPDNNDNKDAKQKPKAARKAAESSSSNHNFNTEHLIEVQHSIRTVLDHFKGLQNDEPLTTLNGGFKAGMTPDAYNSAIETHKCFEAGGNICSQDSLFSTSGGVAVNRHAVRELAQLKYTEPAPITLTIEIAVAAGDQPWTQHGMWERLTPEEEIHAIWFGVAADIQKNGGDEDRAAHSLCQASRECNHYVCPVACTHPAPAAGAYGTLANLSALGDLQLQTR